MKNITILSFILLLSFNACKSIDSSNSNNLEEVKQLKKNQKVGLVIQKSRKTSRTNDDKLFEYFIRTNDKDYFVKFDEGYITPSTLKNYLNKEIVFKGELKKGSLSQEIPASIANPNPPKIRTGDYVAIYKIYK